jgi:hypothetical protein
VPTAGSTVIVNTNVTSATTPTNQVKSITVNSGSTLTLNGAYTNASGNTITINSGGTLALSAALTNSGTTTVNGTVQINGGGYASGTAFSYAATGTTLIMNHNSGLYGISSGQAFWPTTNPPFNVTIQGTGAQINNTVGAVAGTLTVNSQLTCAATPSVTVTGTAILAAQLSNSANGNFLSNGILQINAGGYVSNFAPTYGAASTLVYNSGSTSGSPYVVATEWTGSAATAGVGIPNNVTIQGNTFITMPNGNRGMSGALNVTAGSGITLNGTSGDLGVGGNFTQNGTLTHSGRAINFFGTTTTTQTITGTGLNNTGATNCFAYFIISNTNATGGVTIGENVTIDGTAGDVLQFLNAGTLKIGAFTLTVNGTGGTIRVNGATGGVSKVINFTSASGILLIKGTTNGNTAKAVASSSSGVLSVTSSPAGGQVQVQGGGFNPGSALTTIQTGAFMTINSNGYIDTNSPTYAAGSTLSFRNGGTYGVGNGDKTWAIGASDAGVPDKVEINAAGTNVTISENRTARTSVTVTAGTLTNNTNTLSISTGTSAASAVVINGGTYNNGGGTTTIGNSLTTTSTNALTVSSGTLTNSSGTINVVNTGTTASSAVLISGGTYNNSGGTMNIGNASTTVAATGALTISSGTLTNSSGTITIAALNTTTSSTVVNITGSGTLTNSGGTLNVGPTNGGNQSLTLGGGTLTINNGTVAVNGTVALTTGVFNMSNGNLNIDANSGVTGSSAGAGADILGINSSVTGTVNGGTILINDPLFAGTTGRALAYTGTTASRSWDGNTVQFGGATGNASTSTNGFNVDTSVSSVNLQLGNVIANGGAVTGTRRFVSGSVTAANGFDIGGNLTINASSEVRTIAAGTVLRIKGNIVNNGTLTDITGIAFNQRSGTISSNTSAQTVSGSGTFRNLTASPTAKFTNLTFDNTLAAPAAAVTFSIGDVTATGTVTLTNGIIDIGNNNSFNFVGTASSVARTSGYVLIQGTGQMKKDLATGASSFTFHVGENTGTTEYSPYSLSFSANSLARTIGVRPVDANHPNLNDVDTQTDYISRYWQLSNSAAGTYTYTATATYVANDIVGTETEIKMGLWNGTSPWKQATSSAASNVLTISTALTETTGPLSATADFTGRVKGAVIYTWVGATNALWTTSTNWSPNGVPGALDNVVLANGTTNLSLTTAVTVKNITFNGTGTFFAVGASPAAITATGTITDIGGSGTWNATSTFTISSASSQTIPAFNYGNLNATGGDRVWEGSATTGIAGTFTPGAGTYTATSGSTVDFNGASSQTIAAENYNNLTISGARGTATITLASGTIDVSGSLTFSATGTITVSVTGNTVNFSSASSQTIPAFFYLNITNTGNGPRTLASTGTIQLRGTLTPGSGLYTNTGSTVSYIATSGTVNVNLPSVSSGNSYNILTINGAAGTFQIDAAAVSPINLATTLNVTAGTFNLNTTATDKTFNIGTLNVNGGTLNSVTGTGLPTVNVSGNMALSSGTVNLNSATTTSPTSEMYVTGTYTQTGGTINLQNNTDTTGNNDYSYLQVTGDFTLTAGTFEFATSGVPLTSTNEGDLEIKGNFIRNGTANSFKCTGSSYYGFFGFIGINQSISITTTPTTAATTTSIMTIIYSPSTTTLNSNYTSDVLEVRSGGTLLCGTNVVRGFDFTNEGTLGIGQNNGITADVATATGNIRSTTTRTFSTTANYIYNGSGNQSVGTGLPLTINNLTIANTNTNASGVTLNAATNLTVNGTLTLTSNPLKYGTGASTLTLNGPITTTTGSIVGDNSTSDITIASTGALTNALALSGSFGAFTWSRLTGGAISGSFNVAGNWTNGATTGSTIDLTTNTTTVTLNGAAQTLSGNTTFNNLTINATDAKDFGATTTTIAGIFNQTAGSMTTSGANTFIFTGAAGAIAGATAKNFVNLTISGSGVTTDANSGTVNITGSYNNSGTFTSNPATTINFKAGAAQTLSGIGTSSFGNFTVSSNTTNTTVNAGSHNFSITGDTFDVASNQIFNGQTNTVTFAGGATPTVIGGPGTYNFNGLTINNASTLSNGTNNRNFAVLGNWANNGTYTAGTETISFTGTSTQTVGGSASTTFNSLTVSGAGGGLSLGNSQTINGTLTLSATSGGNIDLNGNNNVTLGATATITGETCSRQFINSGSPSQGNGFVQTTRTLTANPGNVANLGLNIQTATALGSTTIKRFEKGVSSVGLTNSISRVYSITPTTAATGNVTLTSSYCDGELNSNTESTPALVSFYGTGTNETTGYSDIYGTASNDATGNTVTTIATASLIAGQNNITLANAGPDAYYTVQDGDWNTASTWVLNAVPPAGVATIIKNAVTVNGAVTNAPSSITINTGKSLTFGASGSITTTTLTNNGSVVMTDGGVLTITSGGTFANGTNTFTSGTGTLAFSSGGATTGSITIAIGAKLSVASGTLNNTGGTLNIDGTFQINQGGFASGGTWNYGTTGTLVYNNTSGTYGPIDGNHSYWPSSNSPINITVLGAGGINLDVSRTVSGIFQTSAGVSLSGGAVLTLNGTCQINANGFFNNAPTYGGSSTLIYNTGGTYGRGSEWNALSGAGYPANVQIGNGVNTTLNVVNNDNSFKKASGNLTVSAGSTFSIDGLTAQNGSTGVGVEFVGNLINSGNITLSGTTNKRLKGVTLTNNGTITLAANIGADLELSGNYTDNATFVANQRAVFFTGTGTQTISGTATAPFNIDYIVINKPSGIVQLGVDLLTGAPNGGNGITLSSSSDIFDLNGKTFTLGSAAQTCTVSGSGLIRSASNNPGTMIINGTGAMGTLTFETANNTLAGLTINRTSGTGTAGVTLGSALNVTTSLALTSTTTLTLGGTLTVSASTNNTVAGKIAGTGALVKTGSGTLTLTAANGNNTTNTYSVGTTVDGAGTGTIAVTGLTNITSASIASDSQSVTFSTTTPTDGTYQLLPNALTVGTQNFTHNAAPTKAVTFNYTNSTITVGPATITTSAISPTTYCAGAAVTISFTTNGPLSGTYTAQLSDASGSFTSPVAIGTSATNSISGTIPLITSSGTGYRIRVVNIGNSITGSDNGTNITVNANLPASVSVTASPGGAICTGSSVTFTASPTNGGATPAYQWYVGATPVGTNSATFTSTTLANNDVVTVQMTSNASPCLTGSPATSSEITMTVSNNTSWTGAVSNLWSNGANWSCGSVPLDTSIITISSGTPTLDSNFTVSAGGSLTLSDTGALVINSTASLTVAGTAAFNAKPITFKSDASGTAAFGEVTGTVTGATNVTVERHFPAKRAFRFATSAVTTTTSIKSNWQEGVNNADTVYANNQNPNPGFGTHITGTGGSTNGFDTTVSNSASMFGFNNTTAAWTAVTNTNNNILTAGTPYRINIRGSRSVDMSLASPAASATTIRATGALAIGTVSAGTLSSSAYAYNFIGNPYQAPVNMETALDAATNLNKVVYYVWDPRMNTRGAYISVDLTSTNGTPNNQSSGANKFLQPGQACFIRTGATAGSASLNFQESYKVVGSPNTSVFRADTQNTTALSTIKLRLFDSNSLALNLNALDGLVVFFDDAFSSSVDQNDGGKFANPDEMLSTFNNGALISIEKRQHPTAADIIPLRASQYRVTDYTMVAEGTNLNGVPAYLHDQFLQTYTEIPQLGVVNYPFNVATTNTQTTASDRFRIVYTNPLLNTNNTEWMNFTMYPNPSKQGNFNIILPQQINNAKVTIYTTLGKEIYTQNIDAALQTTITPKQQLATGIYYVVLEFESNKSVKKLIIE